MKKLKLGKPNQQRPLISSPQGQQRMPKYSPKLTTQEDMQRGLKKAFQGVKQQQQQARPMIRKPEPEPEPQDEPYWSAQDWEQWALELYQNYPDYRNILPEWFLQAIQ